MRTQLQALRDLESQLQDDLMTFEIRQPPNMDLIKMDKELSILEEVWNLVNSWEEAWESYKSTSFWKIETEQMEEFSNELYKYDDSDHYYCSVNSIRFFRYVKDM